MIAAIKPDLLPRLSPHRLRFLMAVIELCSRRGVCVTVRDLCRHLDMSPNGVAYNLKHLRRMGLVAYEDGEPRTIRPVVRFIPAAALEGQVSR